MTNYFGQRTCVRIVPVQGKDVLYDAQEVVRLGEKRLLQSDEDWDFLSDYLLVLNQNWPRYLAEQRRRAEEFKDEGLGKFVECGYEVLRALNLSETSDVSIVLEQVANAFFSKTNLDRKGCVRVAHLAAALGASLSPDFKFVTQNGRVVPVKETVLADLDADLDSFVDVAWLESHLLHESYFRDFKSCTERDWKHWLGSDRSRVLGFTPPLKNTTKLWSKANLQRLLSLRGYREKLTDTYVSYEYSIEDWDFDKAQWAYWEKRAAEDETYWAKLLRKILAQPSGFWGRALEASAFQLSSRGRNKGTASLLAKDIPAGWVNRFRSLPCLQDTWGGYRLPAELLRRTPVTESLLDVEPSSEAIWTPKVAGHFLSRSGSEIRQRDRSDYWIGSLPWRELKSRHYMRWGSGIIGSTKCLSNAARMIFKRSRMRFREIGLFLPKVMNGHRPQECSSRETMKMFRALGCPSLCV